MKRASYRHAVQWVAKLNPNKIDYHLLVLFIATIFDLKITKVAFDVHLKRLSMGIIK